MPYIQLYVSVIETWAFCDFMAGIEEYVLLLHPCC